MAVGVSTPHIPSWTYGCGASEVEGREGTTILQKNYCLAAYTLTLQSAAQHKDDNTSDN